jgi:hypothetical protein
MAKAKPAPIIENKHVKELLTILKQNNSPSMKDMLAIIGQISTMEKHLESAVNELAAMRTQLAEMEAKNHPIRNTLQKAVIGMQAQILELRDKLAELKQSFIESCKNAVTAFKEKGISALDNVAKFFKIKPALESMRNNLDRDIRADDKAIAKIEAISTEYHEASRHLKNIGLAIIGKEPIKESKPMGIIAKALIAPCKAERNCLVSIKKNVEAAIDSVSRLEDRTKKPSIQATMQKYSDQISQTQTKNEAQPQKGAQIGKKVQSPKQTVTAHDSR